MDASPCPALLTRQFLLNMSRTGFRLFGRTVKTHASGSLRCPSIQPFAAGGGGEAIAGACARMIILRLDSNETSVGGLDAANVLARLLAYFDKEHAKSALLSAEEPSSWFCLPETLPSGLSVY